MTGHYEVAERFAEDAHCLVEPDNTEREAGHVAALTALAQVHALLAVADAVRQADSIGRPS